MTNVLIIGGGAIGLASAWLLAGRGARVTVFEREAVPEQAASLAAAGMLSAQLERHHSEAMAALCRHGRERHVTFLGELTRATGADLDHRQVGALRVALDRQGAEELEGLVADQRRRGWDARLVSNVEAHRIEPLLGEVELAAYFPEERVADPPRIVSALRSACLDAGVAIRGGATVGAVIDAGRSVVLSDGEVVPGDRVVLAGGAWSSSITGVGIEAAVRPIRGQMLELHPARVPTPLLEGPGAYLSPRSDGRLLIGSTLEDVGFDRSVTTEARVRLLAAGRRLVPSLSGVEPTRQWSGLRSGTNDGLPILGMTATGVVAATGHFRNGILLCAITADAVVALVLGESPPVDLHPFRPGRTELATPGPRSASH